MPGWDSDDDFIDLTNDDDEVSCCIKSKHYFMHAKFLWRFSSLENNGKYATCLPRQSQALFVLKYQMEVVPSQDKKKSRQQNRPDFEVVIDDDDDEINLLDDSGSDAEKEKVAEAPSTLSVPDVKKKVAPVDAEVMEVGLRS